MICRLLPLIRLGFFLGGALAATAATVGHWRFEPAPGLLADSGPNSLTLAAQGTAPAAFGLPAFELGSAPGAFFPRTLPQTSAANTTAADPGTPPTGHFSRADDASFQVVDFTIEAFVHRRTETGGTQYIASQWDFTTGAKRSWGLGVAGTSPPSGLVAGELFLVLSGAGSGTTVIGSGLTLLAGTDYAVAASVEASNSANGIVFYRQNLSAAGPLESSTRANPIGTVFNTSADFLIGAYNLGANRWSGVLDEVRLSNTALPPDALLASLPGVPRAAAPFFAPAAGTFLEAVTVTLSSATPGATIRYTLDGSPPTAASPLYTGPFTLATSATVSARAFAADLADSAVSSATYQLTTLPYLGTVKPPRARDIADSNWSVGGETVDRDYTVFAAYRDWLGPLGAKRIRQQAGWAKCEKQLGVYDWAWLDECVDGAL
ncbi:MAG: chitobiase/beta-hexosaminidase C-terminal domain-containing protein, partial [Burkholderiales bacterium]|nr:chitobiase/beta-hexosaminidase C-terminal domain-containing protein [Opitutaceae bacterium]